VHRKTFEVTALSEVEHFYDSMAGVYHLIFDDWDRAIMRQSCVIEGLLDSNLGSVRIRIHDCACGIGTQSIALAMLGHEVSGSDISQAAVLRAMTEAAQRGLHIEFSVSDMTNLARYASHQLDALCAFDNALSHLEVDQLLTAASSFKRVLRPGGVFFASIRDYDQLVQSRPKFQAPSFFGASGERRIVHQVWDWIDRDSYELHQYISLERAEGWRVFHFSSKYRCLLQAEASHALEKAGFVDIEWSMPEATGYYQPVVTARAL